MTTGQYRRSERYGGSDAAGIYQHPEAARTVLGNDRQCGR
jgi:hypothetical protein